MQQCKHNDKGGIIPVQSCLNYYFNYSSESYSISLPQGLLPQCFNHISEEEAAFSRVNPNKETKYFSKNTPTLGCFPTIIKKLTKNKMNLFTVSRLSATLKICSQLLPPISLFYWRNSFKSILNAPKNVRIWNRDDEYFIIEDLDPKMHTNMEHAKQDHAKMGTGTMTNTGPKTVALRPWIELWS